MGPGYGYGPRPYGDDNAASAFQPEKSASLLQPGRMLMEWKTREVSEAGPARDEYLRAVQGFQLSFFVVLVIALMLPPAAVRRRMASHD